MPTRRFSLEPGGAPRVELSWKWNFRDVVLRVDGLEIGRVATANELKLGRDFALVDGSTLRVQLSSSFHRKELVVTRNGEPLPGSSTHPATIVKTAAGVLLLIAVITAGWGVARIFTGEPWGDQVGLLIEGVIYGLLAWRVSKCSRVALVLAILLYAADTYFSLIGGAAGAHSIIVRILIFAALVRAFPAMREIKDSRERIPPSVPA